MTPVAGNRCSMILPVEEFIAWADRLANLEWPIDELQIPEVAEGLGWRPGELEGEFITGLGKPSNLGRFITNSNGVVIEIGFALTPFLRDEGREAQINDWFAIYFAAGSEAFGDPVRVIPGSRKEVWWMHQSGALVDLLSGSRAVLFKVVSPQGLRYQD